MAKRGRPTKTESILRSMRAKPEERTPISEGMYLPNLSGDHSKGNVRATPTQDLDIPNKKYVDDEIGSDHPHQNVTTTAQPTFATTTTSTLFFDDLLNNISDTGTTMNLSSNGDTVITVGQGAGVYTFGNTALDLGNDNLQTSGDAICGKIVGYNDSNTYLQFAGDQVNVYAGGDRLFNFIESVIGNKFNINPDKNNTDMQVNTDNVTNMFTTDASADLIKMGGTTNYVEIASGGDLTFVGTAGLPYGEISATDNAVATVIAVAGTAVQVTIFDTNGPSLNTTPDHTNDHITITKAGHYMVNVSATINSIAGAASRFEITCKKNNGASEIIPHMNRNLTGGSGESGVISMNGIADLAVNDTIEIWIENETNTQNYVVEDICLSLFQIGGT
jgi:hypothetical protein